MKMKKVKPVGWAVQWRWKKGKGVWQTEMRYAARTRAEAKEAYCSDWLGWSPDVYKWDHKLGLARCVRLYIYEAP